MKSIIITGAGTGLGKELALLFSSQGYHIILAGRTETRLNIVKEEIEQAGGSASILAIDIRDSNGAKESLLTIKEPYQIYGLVNNAGVGHFGPFIDMTEIEMEEMFATNTFGTIHMTKAVLPTLIKAEEGFVLNVVSTAGLRGKKNEAIYCASKFAIRGFTESLQKEYEGSNLRFIGAYMGGMNTPFWDQSNYVSDPTRLRSPREVAEIIIVGMETEDTIVIESNK